MLSDQVKSDFFKELGDSLKSRNSRVSLNLKGNGVEQFFSELILFKRLQLLENIELGLIGFFKEDCVGRESQVDDKQDCNK